MRDIRRRTRKQYSAEDKIRIVLAGLRGEDSIAEPWRRSGSGVEPDPGRHPSADRGPRPGRARVVAYGSRIRDLFAAPLTAGRSWVS